MQTETPTKKRSIVLEDLKRGFPNIPPACGEMHAQAILVCFDHHEHVSRVNLMVQGEFSEEIEVRWKFKLTDTIRAYWKDLDEATEQGAVGLAMLLVRLLTGFTIIERSSKGTGFDWYLGDSDDPLFQKKARLEVSGDLTGTTGQVTSRVNQKKSQTQQSDSTRLPAFIIVVEFSKPLSRVAKR